MPRVMGKMAAVPEDQDERQVHVSHEVPSEHARLLVESLHVAGDRVEQPTHRGIVRVRNN